MMEDGDPIDRRDDNEMELIREIAHALYYSPHQYMARDLVRLQSMITEIFLEPVSVTFEFIIRTTLCFFEDSREFYITPVVVVPESTIPDRPRFRFNHLIPYNWRDAVNWRTCYWSAQYTLESKTRRLSLKFDHSFRPPDFDDDVIIYLWLFRSPDGCGEGARIRPKLVEKYVQTNRHLESVLYIQGVLFTAFTEKLMKVNLPNPFLLVTTVCENLSSWGEESDPEAVEALAERNGYIQLPSYLV